MRRHETAGNGVRDGEKIREGMTGKKAGGKLRKNVRGAISRERGNS